MPELGILLNKALQTPSSEKGCRMRPLDSSRSKDTQILIRFLHLSVEREREKVKRTEIFS